MHIRRFGSRLAFYVGSYVLMVGAWGLGLWHESSRPYGTHSTQIFAFFR